MQESHKKQVETLRAAGYRLTPARSTLIVIFFETSEPVSVVELLAQLRKKGLKPNKTTVYREIHFLVERAFLREIEFGDRIKRYELKSAHHHHHVVCTECGAVKDVDVDEDFGGQERSVGRKTGFVIIDHSLEFFGVCPDCQ